MKVVNCFMILPEISIFEIFVVAMVIILKFVTGHLKCSFIVTCLSNHPIT